MNIDQFQGKWHEFKGKIRQKWGKLTDDDIERISGKSEELAGKVQNRYGVSKDKAKAEVDEFIDNL